LNKASNQRIDLIIKTPIGLENVAASRIEELGFKGDVNPKPSGYPGIVIVTLQDENEKSFKSQKGSRGRSPKLNGFWLLG